MPSQILVKAFQSHTSLKANMAEGQGLLKAHLEENPCHQEAWVLSWLCSQSSRGPSAPADVHITWDWIQPKQAAAASPRQCFAPFRLIYNQKLIISHSMGFPYFLF